MKRAVPRPSEQKQMQKPSPETWGLPGSEGVAPWHSRASGPPRHPLVRAWYSLLVRLQVWVGFGTFGLASLLFTLVLPLAWIAFLGNKVAFSRFARVIVRHAFAGVLWQLEAIGLVRQRTRFLSPVQGPALLACNHISLLDVVSVIARVPDCYTFVKSSFVKVPVIRYIIFACGFIPVDPSDPLQSAEAFARARELLAAGAVFVVFPEGTRSQDGRLGPFHKGAFRLARGAGQPLTPVVFASTGPLLNKRYLKLPDGKPVALAMTVHGPGDHLPRALNNAEVPQPSMESEMALLRAFFERHGTRA
jgi:1-acyl-sn-glycerol-3-phosphate acyltransferase